MKIEVVEMFPGGGTLLTAFLQGLRAGGAEVSVAGLIELEEKYLARAAKAHPEASTWTGSAGVWHPAELSATRNAFRVFLAGVPCTGASNSGISKLHLSCAEEHPDVGYLFLPTIHYVRRHRPELVILENTDAYKKTLSARVIRDALEASGYTVEVRIINPFKEFESPTQRKRWVLIASRVGRFSWFYEAKPFTGTLAEYLDPASDIDEVESATPAQVAAAAKYNARKAAEDCGFRMRILDTTSSFCPTLPKTYAKRQHTGIYVRTRTSYRMLRPHEIARIHGFATNIFSDLPKTTQYELYGQGVDARPFRALGEFTVRRFSGERVDAVGQLEFAC